MAVTSRKHRGAFRRAKLAVAALLVGLAFVVPAGSTRAAADDELTNGRLGYRWTPDPPKQPMSSTDQFALDVAKYVGGGILVIWVLRRLFSSD